MPAVGRGLRAAAQLPAAGTFWKATWQAVSKPPLSLTLLLYFLGVYRADTIQATVGNVRVRVLQLLKYLPRNRREKRGAESQGHPTAGGHGGGPRPGAHGHATVVSAGAVPLFLITCKAGHDVYHPKRKI